MMAGRADRLCFATLTVKVSLAELLERRRIVFLHAPLTSETRMMSDVAPGDAMPPDFFLISRTRTGDPPRAASGR